MKTRLAIFVFALLLLPLAGFSLSGAQWSNLAPAQQADAGSLAGALHTSMVLLIYVLIVNQIVKRRTGSAPLDAQRGLYIALCIASAAMGWLLSYLNIFVASWEAPQDNVWIVQLLIYTPAFGLLAPAVLITSALFGSFPGVIQSLNFAMRVPVPAAKLLASSFMALALLGLMGGALWPAELYWLMWISPLLLLSALQALWGENTIFSELKSGAWGRFLFAALSGVIVSNFAAINYQSNASLSINLPSMLLVQCGFAVFGLLCLQLADMLAAGTATELNNSAALR